MKTIKILKNIFTGIIAFCCYIMALFSITFIIFGTCYNETCVRGYSMQPTLNEFVSNENTDGDSILINPYREVQLNDIVVADVIWFPKSIIKRLVGTPGDIIQIVETEDNFELIVNDSLIYRKEKTISSLHGTINRGTIYYYNQFTTVLLENEIAGCDYSENIIVLNNGNKAFKLLANQYFLMGDNWGETTDSTFKGVVDRKAIFGVVDLVIKPSENRILSLFKYACKILFTK